ncbi:hypothetical protein LBMAG49_20870 [Planctomycetota bacterium]|nr:hypothetical protein LBMAG49_20870 [Planctomycetota bacterium]
MQSGSAWEVQGWLGQRTKQSSGRLFRQCGRGPLDFAGNAFDAGVFRISNDNADARSTELLGGAFVR